LEQPKAIPETECNKKPNVKDEENAVKNLSEDERYSPNRKTLEEENLKRFNFAQL